MSFIFSISQAFDHGGIFMWLIFFAQIASFAIIGERIYALYIRRSLGSKKMAKAFEGEVRKGKLEAALLKAQSLGRTHALGRAIQAGAQAAIDMGGREEIQSKMDEVLLSENALLEKRTGFLAAIGNVGTLMGLLGTIVGLIDSFRAVANSNPIEKATLLSNGISMAMYATAYGLTMAIPALVMFAVLQNRANSLSEDLNQGALMIYNWLSYSHEAVPGRKATRS